jgi:hypothetical protein
LFSETQFTKHCKRALADSHFKQRAPYRGSSASLWRPDNSQNNQLGRCNDGINYARPAGAPIAMQFHFAAPIQFPDGVARTSRSVIAGALAGDAVLVAPVSRQITSKQGILQGKWGLWRLGDSPIAKKRCNTAPSGSIPYSN